MRVRKRLGDEHEEGRGYYGDEAEATGWRGGGGLKRAAISRREERMGGEGAGGTGEDTGDFILGAVRAERAKRRGGPERAGRAVPACGWACW